MLDIIITTKDGRVFRASQHDSFLDSWQKESPSNYLKLYMLKNLPLYAREEGLEDEPVKVLKHEGKVIWTEGDTEAYFMGNKYSVEGTKEADELPCFEPLKDLNPVQKQEFERICALYEQKINELERALA